MSWKWQFLCTDHKGIPCGQLRFEHLCCRYVNRSEVNPTCQVSFALRVGTQCIGDFIGLGEKSRTEFQGFLFIGICHIFFPTTFCSGVCNYAEKQIHLWEYLWFSFKSCQNTWQVHIWERFSVIQWKHAFWDSLQLFLPIAPSTELKCW